MISKKTINRILKENKEYFDALKYYDETRKWVLGRKRIDITLDGRIIKKLEEIRRKRGKPISRVIEDCLKMEFEV